MKKTIFLFLGLCLSVAVYSQESTVIFDQDFSSGVPPTDWTIEGVPQQWSQSSSANAGGTAPEAKLTYTSGTYTTRMISPEVDLTGVSAVLFSFKHFLDDYSGSGYSIGVETRSGGGAWNQVWSVNPNGNIGPEERSLLISNADVGASDFQICIFLSGNMYNFDYWYLDDLMLLEPDNLDIAMQSIDMTPYTEAGNVDVACSVKNLGLTAITSFDLNYQVDGGAVVTENVSGVNLQTTDGYSYTFSQQWAATQGSHVIDVWASNINGNGDDDDTSNDGLTMNLSIASSSTQNLPLYEEFTSSTCGPCASFNGGVFTPFMEAHPYDIAVVKYQMNWPGAGDPYYTLEGYARRVYYGVSYVPDLYAGGVQTPTTAGGVNGAFNSETARPAFFEMSADFTIDGTNIDVNVDITPFISAEMRVHIVVIEKLTTGNVGSNGETSFKHVMMKMLPDAEGTVLNFVSDIPVSINESYDMSTTFVEEMDDLAVVVFVQDDSTKRIMQSFYASGEPLSVFNNDLNDIMIYPNPSNGIVNLNTAIPVSIAIYDVLGKLVFAEQIQTSQSIDISNLNSGMYLVQLSDGENQKVHKLIVQK